MHLFNRRISQWHVTVRFFDVISRPAVHHPLDEFFKNRLLALVSLSVSAPLKKKKCFVCLRSFVCLPTYTLRERTEEAVVFKKSSTHTFFGLHHQPALKLPVCVCVCAPPSRRLALFVFLQTTPHHRERACIRFKKTENYWR